MSSDTQFPIDFERALNEACPVSDPFLPRFTSRIGERYAEFRDFQTFGAMTAELQRVFPDYIAALEPFFSFAKRSRGSTDENPLSFVVETSSRICGKRYVLNVFYSFSFFAINSSAPPTLIAIKNSSLFIPIVIERSIISLDSPSHFGFVLGSIPELKSPNHHVVGSFRFVRSKI